MADAWPTIEEIRKTAGIADTELNDQLDESRKAAIQYIEVKTRRIFTPQTETRLFDTNSGSRLVIGDIYGVPSAVTLEPATGGIPVPIEPGAYYLGPARPKEGFPYTWIDLSNADFPTGYRVLSITGNWGFGPTIPDVLFEVCLAIAVRLWKSKQTGFDDRVGTADNGQPIYSRQTTTFDKDVLAMYTYDGPTIGEPLAFAYDANEFRPTMFRLAYGRRGA